MKYSIKLVFGKEQVIKTLSNIELTEEELEINTKEYEFETEDELIAFKKGVDDSVGWFEYHCIETSLCEG